MKRTPLKRGTKTLKRTAFKVKRTLVRAQNRSRASKPKKKPQTITLLKKKLWEECKRITRERYGNVCYTCGKTGLEGGNWHTAHFIPSSICSVAMRYDLDNLRPGCYHCNINLSGNWVAYEAHLMIDHGQNFPTQLKKRNEETKNKQYDILWYQAKLAEYQNL